MRKQRTVIVRTIVYGKGPTSKASATSRTVELPKTPRDQLRKVQKLRQLERTAQDADAERVLAGQRPADMLSLASAS